jgi:hypothetical protein
MVRGIELGKSTNTVVRFGMGNSFQFFGNRMSNYSNIADKQFFNYSNIAVDIRVYILAVQYNYFFDLMYFQLVSLYAILFF